MSVDIGQGRPRITRQLHLDGAYISSRLVDNTARIVLQSRPTGLEWSYPEGSGLRAERRAEEENRKIIRQSTIDNWVPWFVLENGRGELVTRGNSHNMQSDLPPDFQQWASHAQCPDHRSRN